ncbi:transposase [uncultured Gimesia sp.]|uniref:transposase n=1 Tax=uncultured Gimesia sp. TaxID=1678688 RepID=UPI0030DD72E8
MGRPKRAAQAGSIYHVLNRANARMTIFETDGDDATFERILSEAVARFEMRLLSYCVMPQHWHLVVHPKSVNEASTFSVTRQAFAPVLIPRFVFTAAHAVRLI